MGNQSTKARRLSFENRMIVIATIANLLSLEGIETALDSQWAHLGQNWMLALDVPFKEQWDALADEIRRAA